MIRDEVLEELYALWEESAKRFDHDIKAIYINLKKRQSASVRMINQQVVNPDSLSALNQI